ncbi:LysR substrate-binding domain-containing protein, partial [Nocardia goodfellowii]
TSTPNPNATSPSTPRSGCPITYRRLLDEALAEETLLVIDGLPGYFAARHFPESTPSGKRIRRASAPMYWQELLALVAAGKGVTIAAAQGVRYYPRPNLVYIPLEDVSPFEYGLFWREAGLSAKARAFVQTALEISADGGV